MSEFPPPGVAQNPSESAAPALTPDALSAVLADFRAWLTALSAAPRDEEPASRDTSTAAPIDLHTLLGQFLAVRQEVNLQTRAVRAQQEQNAETLRQLTAALDALRNPQQSGDEAIRPFLKTLVDLYDALALASREMQRLGENVLPLLEQLAAAPPAAAPRPLLARWFGAAPDPAQEQRERTARDCGERVRQLLGSLVTGYTMSLQRIERALAQHGLEAITTTGARFDPERMEVVEAVADSGRSAGEVVEELRRGYLWNGRVFRYAQVRVAKS